MVWCAWESAQMDQQISNKLFTESCSKRYLFCLCESHLWCYARPCTGPTLNFSLYINDLPECVNHSEIRLCADDCIVYRCIHNQQNTELL